MLLAIRSRGGQNQGKRFHQSLGPVHIQSEPVFMLIQTLVDLGTGLLRSGWRFPPSVLGRRGPAETGAERPTIHGSATGRPRRGRSSSRRSRQTLDVAAADAVASEKKPWRFAGKSLAKKIPKPSKRSATSGSISKRRVISAAARPYYEQALAINLEILGPKHLDTATSLNNLGFLLLAMQDFAARGPTSSRPWRSTRNCLAKNITSRPRRCAAWACCYRRWTTTRPPGPTTNRPWPSAGSSSAKINVIRSSRSATWAAC